MHVVIQIVLEELLWVFWHRGTFGLKPSVLSEPYIHSSTIQNDRKPKHKFVQIFLLAECLYNQSSLHCASLAKFYGECFLPSMKGQRYFFRQKLGNLMKYFRCGRFRLIVHQASLCVQRLLDEDQVAVYVIMGEIRPVVEPDHDPVGGCSSSVSLLD